MSSGPTVWLAAIKHWATTCPPKDPLLGHHTVAHKGECIGLARRDALEHFGKAGHGKSLLRGFGQREPGEKDGKVITCTLVEIINGLPRVEIH